MPPVPSKRSPDLTRQNLLTAAFNEIHRNGFRAASLDAILASAGVTKGALYHQELGYAVVEEIIRPFVEENWKPAAEAPDMIDAAIELCRRLTRERSEMGLAYGCPFNNLINEMSPVDEGFRERLSAILRDWRAGVSLAIAEGQRRGTIRKDVDPAAASAFIISCIEGCVGMGKAQQSREFLEAGFRGLIDYLEHLRPEPHEH
jgi:TetR/AcrR family transcriptional regulator, transcriptional repressor for nem operon